MPRRQATTVIGQYYSEVIYVCEFELEFVL